MGKEGISSREPEAEGVYRAARDKLREGESWLERARGKIRTERTYEDIENFLNKARALARDAAEELARAEGIDDQLSGLSETRGLIEKLRGDIASVQLPNHR